MKYRNSVLFFFIAIVIIIVFYNFYSLKKRAFFDTCVIDAIHKNKINILFEEADEYKYQGDYLKALTLFEELNERTNLTTEEKLYALNQIAYLYLLSNQDSLAYNWIQKIEQSAHLLSYTAEADYFYNIGTWAYHAFKPKMAETYLRKALLSYEKIYGEKHLRTAECLTQLGHLFYEFSDYPDSIFNYMPRAYDIFQSNQKLKKYSGSCELGMVYINFTKRNNKIGLYHAENAIYLLTDAPFIDSITLARATSFKGQMLKKIAEGTADANLKNKISEESKLYFVKALGFIKENHPRFQEVLRNYMILNIFKNDTITFFKNLDILKENVKKQGNYYAYTERLLGYYADFNSKSNEAINHYSDFIKKYGEDSLVGHSLKTEAYYILINAFSDTSTVRYSHAEALKYANIWLKNTLDNKPQNSKSIQASKQVMYAFIPLSLVAQSYWQKYLKFKKQKDLKNTIRYSQLTDSVLFNTTLNREDNVLFDFQYVIGNELYPMALKAIYEYFSKTKDKTCYDLAFKFMERMKSGILYRDIELLNKSDSLAHIKATLDVLLGKVNVGHITDYKIYDKITILNRQLEKLMQIKRDDTSKLPQTCAFVRQIIKPQQALIQYNLDKEQNILHALYISADTIQFYQYKSADLSEKMLNFHDIIVSYKQSDTAKKALNDLSYNLYNVLIASFKKDLDKRSDWVIVPDRMLHQIPFECLMTTSTPKIGDNTTSFLINKPDLTISYTPSWKLFCLNASKNEITNSDKMLYFTYGKGSTEIPCSAEETDSVKQIFKGQVEVFTESKCTKEAFLRVWTQQYGMLHLALHAQGKSDSIMNNKIWFKPNKQDAMYGFELTGFHTRVKLVILSACETNVGYREVGEGIYSMSRYFFQSGAKTVIASLWQIEDCPNTQILRFFYRQLRGGAKPKQALCQAKRLFLKQSSDNILTHPAYWAGLVCLD